MKYGAGSEDPKSKPKGALAALVVGAPSSTSDMEPDADDMEPETDHGFRAVAKAFGIPPEREAAAQAALKQYVQSCARSAGSDEPEEEY